jgi:hypothetical protein
MADNQEARPELPRETPPSKDQDLLDALDLERDSVGLNEFAQPRTRDLLEHPPVEERPRDTRPRPPAEPAVDDRLAAALKTIEEQNQRIQGFESRIAAAERGAYHRELPPPTREPQVEYEEVFPGRQVPKDATQRPIRLTEQDLLRLGWNENPARAIETLANAFLGYIVDSIPQYTMNQYDQKVGVAQQAWHRKQYFWQQFPDLQEHETFVGMLEQQAQQAGYLTPAGKTQDVYNREVAGLARQRIASMRGLSVDQYMDSLPKASSGQAPRGPASRAQTAGGGRGPRPSREQGDRYLDDL